MKDEQRIECLKEKRRDLKRRIKAEANRPMPDDLGLRRMKNERCRLKDQIIMLERRTGSAAVA